MSSYNQSLYQIVFSTKYREKTLTNHERPELFKAIWGILKNNDCHLYRINGVEDHLHILTSVHQTVAVANLVKDIKLGANSFIKEKGIFKYFNGWQVGYGAFTYFIDSKDNLIEYIKDQENHHKTKSSREEMLDLLREHRVPYDMQYFE